MAIRHSIVPLYHLSEENLDNNILSPRPMDRDRVMEGENWKTPRICVSTSIDGAVSALVDSMSMPNGLELYVHTIVNAKDLFKRHKVYKPSLKQVPDADCTEEHWLKDKAKLKCIGKIIIGHPIPGAEQHYVWDGEYTTIDRFEWRWI